LTPTARRRKTADMRHRSAGVALGVIAAIAAGAGHLVMADEKSPISQIVVKAGSVTVTAGDIEHRIGSLPAFQLAALGRSADEIRRNVVDRIVVPEALFTAAASAKGLEESPALRDRIVDVLRTARLNALASEISASASVGPEAVARYYEANKTQFDFPERISVWRILCPTSEDAMRVLQEVKTPRDTQRWIELARERSIDKATAMRGGDLGFLSADGASSMPTVKVDPALFAAAHKVKDAAIVPDPVAEGTGFAVVWRRSATPAVHRTLEQEASAIRQLLLRQQTEQASRDLVASLRRAGRVEVHPEIVDAIEIEPPAGALSHGRPGAVPVKPQGSMAPSATPRGLR
jgi:peptidyl-prolyl cis-trans isomerase C